MDPSYISDMPGKSPMGMDLVPVYEDEAGESRGGAITIDPVVVQNMGVRIAPVKRGAVFRHVRTIGTVDVAESEISVVNLRYSGWIERIHVDETGVQAKKGQALFDIYSPELVSAQEEYLLALRTAGKDSPLARSTRSRLELWDLPSWLIDKVEKAGKPLRNLTVVAPQSGYVLHKNVVQGARVMAGVDLYRIGNLAKIWVNADVYEFDAPWIELGQKASMELSFEAGRTYDGKVSYIYPTLNMKTRTLTVRLEFDNPGLALKPGMFATVQIEAQRKSDVLELPTEAIIHSGTRQIVFVARSLGKYEMREITTGVVGDRHRTEVLSGLSEGERVVTSGQFLLDSESQLQEAVQKLLAARLQARAGRAAGAASSAAPEAGHDPQEDAGAYWTCGMHPQVVQDHPGTCPICGMDLIGKKKGSPGTTQPGDDE
jgi:Cu(I)/Ag(I) efflux system membrane fusion protein/cobalt-zinc-cadmium efflux system membrane fusion protein